MDTDLEGRRDGVLNEFRGVADEIQNRIRIHVEYEARSSAQLRRVSNQGDTLPLAYSAWPTDSAEVVSSNRNFLRLKGSVKQSPQNVMK